MTNWLLPYSIKDGEKSVTLHQGLWSRKFFQVSLNNRPTSHRELIQESKRILGLFPWSTQEKTHMATAI
jgi:hypothetical protein